MRFHTSLPVQDIKATIDFYQTLFGAGPAKVKKDYAKFLPPSGGLNISFHQMADVPPEYLEVHLGFELPDQEALNLLHKRLLSTGLVSEERDTSICCYANQDKFWVQDPTGYRWELYVLLEDTALKIDPEPACCPPAKLSEPAEQSSPC